MGLSRRALIKQAAAAIAALGLTDVAAELRLDAQKVQGQAATYGQALAAGTKRKLALLIGIDKYAEGVLSAEQTKRLSGCTTDISLQKELLIHRFGFLPEDIVCLSNEQATRQGIYKAFFDHLYSQAGAGDAVVVHFSGYGAQVRLEESSDGAASGAKTVRSLVPYDGVLPTAKRPVLKDILEAELIALLKQLKTKNVTTVVDAGYVDIAVPLSGGLRSRARAAIATGRANELFPLLEGKRLPSDNEGFPGTLLRAAELTDSVIERQWSGFSAGAFTYVLTQYLWTATAPTTTTGQLLGHSQETLLRWGGSNQQPALSGTEKYPVYSTPVVSDSRGEGVVKAVSGDGKTATLWLGGLPPRVLEYATPPAVMTCGGRRLKLRSHDGLIGKAKLVEAASNDGAPLKVGQPVFESVRVLPKSIDLVVALDSQLQRIERVDATSALSVLPFVVSTSDTELPADCLLSKALPERGETLTASLQPRQPFRKVAQAGGAGSAPTDTPTDIAPDGVGAGYGLFSLTRSLIPGTLAMQDEAIKPAIARLTEKLRSLTALKMLRLTENKASSQLPVRVRLDLVSPDEKQLIARRTLRPEQFRDSSDKNNSFIPQVPVGSRVRYHVFNDGDKPLFYTLINVDPRERLSAFCPVIGFSAQPAQQSDDSYNEEANSLIAAASILPGSSVSVPSADLDWSVETPTGPVETYVVCSTSPLTNTFRTLLSAAAISGRQRVSPLPNPLEVVKALLSDISQDGEADEYMLDVAQWATLNFTYQAA